MKTKDVLSHGSHRLPGFYFLVRCSSKGQNFLKLINFYLLLAFEHGEMENSEVDVIFKKSVPAPRSKRYLNFLNINILFLTFLIPMELVFLHDLRNAITSFSL